MINRTTDPPDQKRNVSFPNFLVGFFFQGGKMKVNPDVKRYEEESITKKNKSKEKNIAEKSISATKTSSSLIRSKGYTHLSKFLNDNSIHLKTHKTYLANTLHSPQ